MNYKQKFALVCEGQEYYFDLAKSVERPSLSIEEIKQEDGSYKIGKHAWQPIVTLFKNITQCSELWEIFKKILNENLNLNGKLEIYNELDELVEEWTMKQFMPLSLNFEPHPESPTPNMKTEISWKFKECQYQNLTAKKD